MTSPIQARLDKIRRKVAEEGLDALLVSTPENRRYLSGFTGSAGYLVITATDAVLATDFRYVEQGGRQAPDFRVVRIGTDDQWLPRLLAELGVRRVGLEGQHLTVSQYKQFADVMAKAWSDGAAPSLVAVAGLVEGIRAVKDALEVSLIQRAIDIADAAFQQVVPALRPGITERQVSWELEKLIREQGADSVSFDLIVAAGAHGAMPHHRPSDRPIERGEPVVVDMGARYSGYCSDMTRTLVLGAPDATFRKVYDTVLAAQETAIATVQAGMVAEGVDGLARAIIAQAGYGDAFGHGLGHGVGLAIHEHPRVAPTSQSVLEDGMVFTIEPGIYLSGWGGVRIEDMVILEEGRARVLTHAHKLDHVGD